MSQSKNGVILNPRFSLRLVERVKNLLREVCTKNEMRDSSLRSE